MAGECSAAIVLDDNQHVRCAHCDDDLGPPKADPDEQYEQVTPTGSCWPCAMGQWVWKPGVDEYDPDHEAVDVGLTSTPCPLCGSANACGFDDEGRPLIHALTQGSDE